MKVKELINILEQCDPEANLTILNAYVDSESNKIYIANYLLSEELMSKQAELIAGYIKSSLNIPDKNIDDIYTLAARM